MANKPNDTTPKLNAYEAAPNSREPNEETAHELFMRLTLNDPQFIQAKPTGKAFVIGGMKPK